MSVITPSIDKECIDIMTLKIENPVIKGFNPDPSLLRVGDDYYLANSTFQWFPGVSIYHSTNLVDWEFKTRPLDSEKLLPMRGIPDSGGVWAPDLTFHNGKFWLVYSNVKSLRAAFKDTPNFLITADSINGPWSDPIFLNANGFDASMFHDDDGRHYLVNMVWDHRMYKHQFFGIQLREYSESEQRLIGEPRIIWTGTPDALTEGPHLYKINGYYYLFCAQGGTHWAHQETVARSKELWKDYENEPDGPLLSAYDSSHNYLQKCGHASLINTIGDEWYIAHLMARPLHHDNESIIDPRGWCPLGRETSIQKVEWDSKGWPHVVGGRQGSIFVDAPKEISAQKKPDKRVKQFSNFDNTELDNEFQTLRVPFSTIGEITSDEQLTLYGQDAPSSLFDFSQVSRRWQSFDFVAETKIKFNPDSFQQLAGMSNYYDSKDYTAVYVTYDEQKSKRVIEVMECDAENYSFKFQDNATEIPDNLKYVYLRTTEEGNKYTYSYSFDGDKFTDLCTLDSLKLSDDYIESIYGPSAYFTGAFVGMFATDLTGERKQAKFDYFKYYEK